MSNVITLDYIRDSLEKEFGNTEIPLPNGQNLVLSNPVRMDKADRKALAAALRGVSADYGDLFYAVGDNGALLVEDGKKRLREDLSEEEEDLLLETQIDRLVAALAAGAKNPNAVPVLVEAVAGPDQALMLQKILAEYISGQEVGEA